MNETDATIHVGDRIADLARRNAESIAVVLIDPRGRESVLTWAELEQRANIAARALEARGVHDGSIVGIALPTGFDHLAATIGAWKLGGTVVPLNPNAGARERRLLRQAITGLVVGGGDGDWADVGPSNLRPPGDGSPFVGRGQPQSASVSGGTTGEPRIILRNGPWRFPVADLGVASERWSGAEVAQTQLVVLPLYHAGFTTLYHGLVLEHTIVLLSRFTARAFFGAMARHRVDYVRIVPLYMRLALELPDLESYDVTSVKAVTHAAAACPASVKRRWLDVFGPEKVIEAYTCTEAIGIVRIRGDEWLEHPGSVGKPTTCEARILDDDGHDVPAGEIGQVFLRRDGAEQPRYIGAGAPLPEQDGYRSVGDLGYIGEDGYLYLVDRKANVINSGGIDIYPAEIEATLLEHPDVADVVVTGRAHDYLGNVLHAIVVPADQAHPPEIGELERHCRGLLTTAKVPISYELREEIGRRETGKLWRRDL